MNLYPALHFVNGTTPLFSLSEFRIVRRSVFVSLSLSAFRVVSFGSSLFSVGKREGRGKYGIASPAVASHPLRQELRK